MAARQSGDWLQALPWETYVSSRIPQLFVAAAGPSPRCTLTALCAQAAIKARRTLGPADPRDRSRFEASSAQRIQANIEKLVSFQNPAHALRSGSGLDQSRPRHRRGAGMDQVANSNATRRIAAAVSRSRPTASPKAPPTAFPSPRVITNVYAVLKGTDPESAKRIVLVTGHYDSRNSDTFDVSGIAPGANDDASGTAVSLECARVLSKLKFPATIIFLTVAGEEQGLNGSRISRRWPKQKAGISKPC